MNLLTNKLRRISRIDNDSVHVIFQYILGSNRLIRVSIPSKEAL